MARGDGKAQRGRTRGSNVIKMAAGGNLAARDAAMGGAAVGSRAEASRSTSSGGVGASSGGFGASTRDGGFGGADRGYPDDRRVDLRSNPNTFTRTERTSAMTSPDAMRARLGPNAAQAMVDAGVAPDVSRSAADSINRRATDARSILGDPNPGQRLATANRDGSFTYSPIQSSTIVKNQKKQFYDRILPEEEALPVRQQFPTRPISYTGVPKMEGTPIDTGWDPVSGTFRTASTPTLPSRRMTSAQDMASIVPGSVSFTQRTKDVPFAETSLGQSLLARSKQPMTEEQAKAFAKQMPAGSNLIGSGLAALKHPTPPGFNQAQYNSYPATIEGYNFSVNVPKSAVINTPYGPKVGQYNPAAQQASPLASYTGQEQRFAPAPAIRGQEQRFAPAPASGGAVAPPQGASTPAVKAPSNVVAGRANFGPARAPFDPFREGRGGEGRPRRGRKKPIIEEETITNARHGGAIRGDGKAVFGKTKGRYI